MNNILFTKEPKEAIKIAKQNVDNYEIIVAVGVDGTINEVAKGIISVGRGILGIVPGGTGNDMAKSLGISMDPEKSLEMLNRGLKREILWWGHEDHTSSSGKRRIFTHMYSFWNK